MSNLFCARVLCVHNTAIPMVSSSIRIFPSLLIAPLLEVLEYLDPTVQPDAVVYCMGAIKLLCSNSDLRTELVACGAVKSIANLLKKLTEVRSHS